MNLSIWFPFSKKLDDVPTKLFLSQHFPSVNPESLERFVVIITLLIGGLLTVIGQIYSQDLFYIGILTLLLLPRIISAILDVKLSLDQYQFDLDALFALNEILTVASTTGSEAQSIFLLSNSYNIYLQYVAKKAVIAKSTFNPIGSEAFIEALKELWPRPSQQLFVQYFENWNQNTRSDNQNLTQQLLLNHIQTQLKKDETYLDNWTTYLNAFLGLLPIFILFTVFLSSATPRFTLELTLLALVGSIFIFNFLDPYRIHMMSVYVGDLEDTRTVQGGLIADTLVKALQRNPDFYTGLRDVLNILPTNLEIQTLNHKLALGEIVPISDIIDILKPVTGGKERLFLEMTLELCQIDVTTANRQLVELIKNLSLLETENNKKKGVLLGEKRKAVLLMALSAFSLGLLIVISPLFLQLANIKQFTANFGSGSTSLSFPLPISSVLEVWFMLLLLVGNYISIFRLRKKNGIIIIFVILSLIFLAGLLFAMGLVQPDIILE